MSDGTSVRRALFSEDWQKALSSRGSNGFTKHAYQSDVPRAGYFRIKREPVHIIELNPTDEMTGELVGDVTYEAYRNGERVAETDVWPWAGKMPISRKEYDDMLAMQSRPAPEPDSPASDTYVERPTPKPAEDTMQSAEVGKLAQALAKAQGSLEHVLRDHTARVTSKRTGQTFTYNYAGLDAVWDVCRKALADNEIAVVQSPKNGTGGTLVTLTTKLIHSSGEWIAGEATMKAAGEDPQSLGSTWTYLRRYSLASMVGVAFADEDDDANKGTGNKSDIARKPAGPREAEAQKAAEYANGLMASIDRCESSVALVKLMNAPGRKEDLEKLETEYPDLYAQVRNIQQKRAGQLTKAAA